MKMRLSGRRVYMKLMLIGSMFLLFTGQLLFTTPQAVLAVGNYDDYSDEHSYPTEQLKKLINVYSVDGQYNRSEVQDAIDILDTVPQHFIDFLEFNDVKVIFIDFPLTKLPRLSHLDDDGEPPRGYKPGKTYTDDVFGLYTLQPSTNDEEDHYIAMITRWGERDSKYRTRSSITLHELGHAVSYGPEEANWAREYASDLFLEIHKEEQRQLFPDNDYYNEPSEYFAESFAYYYLDDEHHQELKAKAPKTYDYIKNLQFYTLYLDDVSIEKLGFYWQEIEGAVSYDIYRDDLLIDNIKETAFFDRDYTDYFHDYEVIALDADGQEIHAFNRINIKTELHERQFIDRIRENAAESDAFEKKMEESVTLETILEDFNIPTKYMKLIILSILFAIFILLPASLIGMIIYLVRRKKRKNK